MEITDEVDESTEATSTSLRKGSNVWDHFWKLPLNLNPDSRLRAECKECHQVYLADSIAETSNLKRHQAMRHSDVFESGRHLIVNNEMFRELMAKAIVRHNLPFAFVEYEGVREIHSFLNPTVKTISRNTSKVDVLKLYQKQKKIIHEELAKIPIRVCLTTDMWTSITLNGYFFLTAHFVDLNWVLQKRVLIFHHVPPPHTGQVLGPTLINFLKEWGIEKKEYMKYPESNSALVQSTIDERDTEMRDEFDLFESQPESSSEKSQLDLYLEEPVLDRKGNANLDVLKFWKDKMNKYPELSLMARDVLSIPISTVASESTFSIGGRVIERYQSSILPENAEAKLCAQDWLYRHGVADDSD